MGKHCINNELKPILDTFLSAFIAERGGVMSVFNGTTVVGWWRGVKGPIGRIGTPINNREYLYFRTLEIELYIEKALIDDLPNQDFNVKVLMGDYGCRLIHFIQNKTGKGDLKWTVGSRIL